MTTRQCCYIYPDSLLGSGFPCERTAEFTIWTTVDGAVAGPDPYSDFTDACEDHVGRVLGHQPDLDESLIPSLVWHVRPI